jgi:hypothetical protein
VDGLVQDDAQVRRVGLVEDALPRRPGGDLLLDLLVTSAQRPRAAQGPGVVGRLWALTEFPRAAVK